MIQTSERCFKIFWQTIQNNEISTHELWRSCRFEIFESLESKEEKRQNNFEHWKIGFIMYV